MPWLPFLTLLFVFVTFTKETGAVLRCYCLNGRCDENNIQTCDGNPDTVCFGSRHADGTLQYGCFTFPGSPIPGLTREDCLNHTFNAIDTMMLCCNDTNFCNQKYEFPPLETTPPSNMPSTSSTTEGLSSSSDPKTSLPHASIFLTLIILVPIMSVIFLAVVVITSIVCILRCRKRQLERRRQEISPFDCEAIELEDEMTRTCTSGSGSGLPFLVQRTVARSIKLNPNPIGSGRFGQVYLGEYLGEKIAVKKFASRDEQSWFRETEIYNTILLRHENVLGFFASDMVSNNDVTELWLITQYHPHGSLYDYLNQETVSPSILLMMSISICNGLAHLHTEIFGTLAKPAIAHRDIKSKNILVKRDLQCCIADFGLAVMKKDNGVNLPTNPKQGTKRYMAPEILNETMNMKLFNSFKQADVYALGLVMWEICRRCEEKNGMAALNYELPFQGLVPPDPSFDDMKRVVVIERRQPTIQNSWHQNDLLREITKLLRECWYFDSAARPPVVYLKKKLTKLSQDVKVDRDEHE